MYDAKNTKEIEGKLKADTIYDGVIFNINDGKVKDFISNPTKWDGDVEQQAINVEVEVPVECDVVRFKQLFTYGIEASTGVTLFHKKSNMGKFKAKYGKVPETSKSVKVMADKEGFAKILLV